MCLTVDAWTLGGSASQTNPTQSLGFPTGIVTTARKIAVVVINICIEVTNVFTSWKICSYL